MFFCLMLFYLIKLIYLFIAFLDVLGYLEHFSNTYRKKRLVVVYEWYSGRARRNQDGLMESYIYMWHRCRAGPQGTPSRSRGQPRRGSAQWGGGGGVSSITVLHDIIM